MITCMYYAKTKLYMYIYILRASLCACVHQCYIDDPASFRVWSNVPNASASLTPTSPQEPLP